MLIQALTDRTLKETIYFLTVNYHTSHLLPELFDSIPSDEKYLFVVVNNSPNDNLEFSEKKPAICILESGKNVGFATACNTGLQWIYDRDPQALVWAINPDARLQIDSLKNVAAIARQQARASILGTAIYKTNGTVWFGGGFFQAATGTVTARQSLPDTAIAPCDWVSGCSCILDLAKFSACPQFDPQFFLYYEDFDFCQRYRREGHRIAIARELAVVHAVSAIADRNPRAKYRYSTESYLLALQRYAHPLAFYLRFWRLVANGIFCLCLRREIGVGKLRGVWRYLRKANGFEPPTD